MRCRAINQHRAGSTAPGERVGRLGERLTGRPALAGPVRHQQRGWVAFRDQQNLGLTGEVGKRKASMRRFHRTCIPVGCRRLVGDWYSLASRFCLLAKMGSRLPARSPRRVRCRCRTKPPARDHPKTAPRRRPGRPRRRIPGPRACAYRGRCRRHLCGAC